ncbi:mitochondrial carrier protein MTM1-like [Vitis riparia]|uniref:mitochondrial carrier protein MTM1-like n=1 Tax=Vitis riparia TaxID=96939 RepID=UPI00155A7CB3|nr:mitochondrial carrier protein MTM1-like [Vitis riparia]
MTRRCSLEDDPICGPIIDDVVFHSGYIDFTAKLSCVRHHAREGFARLWRGTNAGPALAVTTVGIYLLCYDIFCNWLKELMAQNAPSLTVYVPLVAGSLARSLAYATCYPIELARTWVQGGSSRRKTSRLRLRVQNQLRV